MDMRRHHEPHHTSESHAEQNENEHIVALDALARYVDISTCCESLRLAQGIRRRRAARTSLTHGVACVPSAHTWTVLWRQALTSCRSSPATSQLRAMAVGDAVIIRGSSYGIDIDNLVYVTDYGPPNDRFVARRVNSPAVHFAGVYTTRTEHCKQTVQRL